MISLLSLTFSGTVYTNSDWLNVRSISRKQTGMYLTVGEFTIWEGVFGEPSTLNALPCITLPAPPLASLQALGLPTLWRCLHSAWHHHAFQLGRCSVVPSNGTYLFPERALWLRWTVQGEITVLGPRYNKAIKRRHSFQCKPSPVDFSFIVIFPHSCAVLQIAVYFTGECCHVFSGLPQVGNDSWFPARYEYAP